MQFKICATQQWKLLANQWLVFIFQNTTKKNHIEKQLKHQNETEENVLKLERKRKIQQPPPSSHGLVINSNKTTMLPKRACSDADVTCHCQIETRFYPCLLTSHTQWLFLSLFFPSLNIAVGKGESQQTYTQHTLTVNDAIFQYSLNIQYNKKNT